MNKFIALLALLSLFFNSQAQQTKSIKLSKIIYHSSGCFGTCPVYDLQIDRHRNIKLAAPTVFKSTGRQIDSTRTGNFCGKLSSADYATLINKIEAAGIDTLKFPDVTCCDGVVTTLIVYYNGKKKYLKSMLPANQSKELIAYLFSICERKDLHRTKKKFDIEK